MCKIYKFFRKANIYKQLTLSLAGIMLFIVFVLILCSGIITSKIIFENAEKESNSTIEYASERLDEKFLNISTAMDHLITNRYIKSLDSSKNNETELKNITDILNVLENSVDYFEYISIMNDDEVILRYGNAYDKVIYDCEYKQFVDVYNKDNTGKIRIVDKIKPSNDTKQIIVLSKSYRVDNKPFIVDIGVSEEFINSTAGVNSENKNGSFVILKDDGTCVYKNGNIKLEKQVYKKIAEKNRMTNNILHEAENGTEIICKKSYITGDFYMYIFNKNDIVKKYIYVCLVYLGIAIVIIAACVIIGNRIIRKILSLLIEFSKKLEDFAGAYMQKNDNRKISVASVDQAESLYDDMFVKIENLMQYIKTKERDIASMEKQVLQEQINPHFIYNTLEIIQMTSEVNDDSDVSEMIGLLGELLRYGLDSKNETLVPLKDEFCNLRKYVVLANYKNQYPVSFNVRANDDVLDFPIPRVALQPLVENSFFHGNLGRKENGKITIDVSRKDDILCIKTSDNGDGFDMETPHSSKSMGLKNVEKRFKLYFGNNVMFEVSSEQNKGTDITIKIPYSAAEDYR